jgi:lincosamide nucleotidyltransferase A/C/D/E
MMGVGDVLAVLEQLEAARVQSWLDGGWGVDALLHTQTRQHDDLDLVIARADESQAVTALAALGRCRPILFESEACLGARSS